MESCGGSRIEKGRALLDCLAAPANAEKSARIRNYSREEWAALVLEAREQRLAPLLFERLKDPEIRPAVPAGVMEKFERAYYAVLKQNLRLYHEFKTALAAFREAGIPLIVLKGAHLAEAIYGNPGVRPMTDIDILVAKDDLEKAETVLRGLGFQASPGIGRIEREVECGLSRELPLHSKPGGIFFDVHWTVEDPASPFAIDVEGLWARAQTIEVAGVKTRGLSTEDLILHMCLHTAYHDKFRAGVMPLCDAAEIVQKRGADMDWAALGRRAFEWKAGKWVYVTLRMAKDLLKAAVPDEFLERLKPADFNAEIAALARAKIMARDEELSPLSPNLTLLWGGKPLPQKASAYLRRIFPRREHMVHMYPASGRGLRIYYYYAVRLKDLVRRYGLKSVYRMYVVTSWRMLRNKPERTRFAKKDSVLTEWLSPS